VSTEIPRQQFGDLTQLAAVIVKVHVALGVHAPVLNQIKLLAL
jgi:hypothetical protein